MEVSFNSCTAALFHLAWCQIFQCAMRSFGIVKLNIGSYTGLKCSIGRMIFPVEFFFFQRCEEWFCDRVIMRLAGLRKGLLRIVFMQKLLKPVRGILRSTVAMKNKTRWGMAFFMRHFKCCSEKLGAVLFWNFMCDHFAWEKVDNHANIKVVIPKFKTGDIADPSLIWPLSVKLLPQDIFLSFRFTQL